MKINAADFIFADPIHRSEKSFTIPMTARIRQIVTMHYSVPSSLKSRFKGYSVLTSNFVKISDPAVACKIYQSVHEIERTDFSYTCTDNGKITQFYAIKNHETNLEKENAFLLVMSSNLKKVDGKQDRLVSLAVISIEKMKLKLMNSYSLNLGQEPSKLFVVNQKIRSTAADPVGVTPIFFECAFSIQPGKVIFFKASPNSDWFNALAHSQTHFNTEIGILEEKDTTVGFAFDTSDSIPVRLLICTKSADRYKFQICRENTDQPNQFKLMPECFFSTGQLSEKFPSSDDNHSTHPAVFLNSNLKFIGLAGLSKSRDDSSTNLHFSIVLIHFDDSSFRDLAAAAKKKEASHLTEEMEEMEEHHNTELKLGLPPHTFEIEADCSVFQSENDFPAELQTAHTELELDGFLLHLMAFGVTGSKCVYWLLAAKLKKQTSEETKHSQLMARVIEVRLAPDPEKIKIMQRLSIDDRPASDSRDNKDSNYLNALGQSIFICRKEVSKPVARVAVSFGNTSTFELELEISKWMRF